MGGGSPGGCGADPGVRLLRGEGGGGVRPARVGLGDRKSDSPRPAPCASSSNPSLHPRPSSGRGEAGRREGGVPRRTGQLEQVRGTVVWFAGPLRLVALQGREPLQPDTRLLGPVFLKPTLAWGPQPSPYARVFPPPPPPAPQSFSLESPGGRGFQLPAALLGTWDQFLPRPSGPIKVGQSRQTPFTIGSRGGERAGKSKGN